MENASKALIISASILIGVIILSIAVYLFASFGGTSREIQKKMDSRALAEFNNNFTKYLDSNSCTIHDIVNLAKFARKTNEEMEYTTADSDKPYYVQVILDKKDITQYSEEQLIDLLNNNSIAKDSDGNSIGSLQYYRCEDVRFDNPDNPNRVSKIIFKEV